MVRNIETRGYCSEAAADGRRSSPPRAKQTIARVAEAGKDVPLLVELAIERGDVDGDLGVFG
jgi:hypothetical protein